MVRDVITDDNLINEHKYYQNDYDYANVGDYTLYSKEPSLYSAEDFGFVPILAFLLAAILIFSFGSYTLRRLSSNKKKFITLKEKTPILPICSSSQPSTPNSPEFDLPATPRMNIQRLTLADELQYSLKAHQSEQALKFNEDYSV